MPSLPRIVSLISSATEMLYALGLEDRLLAVSHECDYPPAARNKPRATRSNINPALSSLEIDDQVRELSHGGLPLYELETELIVGLAPDLIITQAQCDVCAIRYDDVIGLVHSRKELAATKVLALSPSFLADMFADVVRVGEAAGVLQMAQHYVDSLRQRVAGIRAITDKLPLPARPRVLCLEWLDPPMPASNWTPELVQLAGGTCGLGRLGQHSTYAAWGDILAFDPQVLIAMPCGFDLTRTLAEAAALPGRPGWNDLSAVRSGRVFAVDGNAYFNRSGPRLVESLEILAHLVQPDWFGPPLPAAERPSAWRSLLLETFQ